MRPMMHLHMTRRGVLASVAGAALGLVTFAYPGLARVLTTVSRPLAPLTSLTGRDPGFAGGVVQSKTADSLVLSNVEYTRTVRIPPGSTVWKEFDVSLEAVNVGDRVQARGEPQSDGSLLARPGWVWVNITTWHGTIVALRPNGLLTKRHDGIQKELAFSPRLEVISGTDLSPVAAGTGALVEGVQIGAVGLSLPDWSLRATRIWIDGR